MPHLSAMVMTMLSLLGQAAGSPPAPFRAVDADSDEPLPGVMVRQLPSPWEIRSLLQRSRGPWSLAPRFTDTSGVVRCDIASRCTWFFEAEGYASVDLRVGWFGLKAYEEPYTHGTNVKSVDGVYVVPLRRKDGP